MAQRNQSGQVSGEALGITFNKKTRGELTELASLPLLERVEKYIENYAGQDHEADKRFVAAVVREAQVCHSDSMERTRRLVKAMNGGIMRPYNIRLHDGYRRGVLAATYGRDGKGALAVRMYNPETRRPTMRSFKKATIHVISVFDPYCSSDSDLDTALDV